MQCYLNIPVSICGLRILSREGLQGVAGPEAGLESESMAGVLGSGLLCVDFLNALITLSVCESSAA